MQKSIYEKSVAYLESDPLKHITTLKYLLLYRDQLTVDLTEDSKNWALLVTIPTQILSFDTATYPYTNYAIFINGTADGLKYELLETLPNSNYILRLNESLDLSKLRNRFDISKGKSYISYSCSSMDDSFKDGIVPGNTVITDEAIDIIKRNGYTESEIRWHFNNGAVWFGLLKENRIRSICFVYQNYDDIWEIAGVHTLETERGKGYARIVVASALAYLFEKKLTPRYMAEIRNTKSIQLAESLQMKQFLRMDHFLLRSL
ncbi:MAG TPA: GNAT family N-acetyltransferase [Bacillota bacterium]